MQNKTPVDLSDDEKSVIASFARGNESLREQAITIFRNHLQDVGPRNTPHMCFMAEIDNVCPDPILRRAYRDRLLQIP